MKKIAIVLTAFLFIITTANATEFRQLLPSDHVNLPSDLYFKPNFRSQWWYATGHLVDEQKRPFGFELTFFAVRVDKTTSPSAFHVNTLYVVHAAITDIAGEKFYFNDAISRGEFDSAGADPNTFHVWLGQNRMKGNLITYQLKADNNDFTLALTLTNTKSPVRNGVNGYSNKIKGCPECASLYFSTTRQTATGTLQLDDNTFNVSGTAWFDREINSDSENDAVKGWDWFSIQLDDGRDIMLYNIRHKNGGIDPASSGTIVYSDGTAKIMNKNDFVINKTTTYTSKKTGITYPAKWNIIIPSENIQVTVIPKLQDQEVIATYTTFNTYWEGACSVNGSHTGNAYVELSGYK